MTIRRKWEELGEDEQEWVMERAGIREFDGGLSRGAAYIFALEDLYAKQCRDRVAARAARQSVEGAGSGAAAAPAGVSRLEYAEDALPFEG